MSIIVFTILLLLGVYCAGLLGSLTGLGGSNRHPSAHFSFRYRLSLCHWSSFEGVSKLIHPLFYSSFTLCTTLFVIYCSYAANFI